MKFSSVLCGSLAAMAVTAINPRQLGAGRVAAKQEQKPQFRTTAKRTVTYFGPYSLKAAGSAKGVSGGMGGMSGMGGEDAQNYVVSMKGSNFCPGGCMVLAGKIHLNYTDGTKADGTNGLYIHHVITSDQSKRQAAFVKCQSGGASSGIEDLLGVGFVGAGDDNSNSPFLYTSKDGQYPSGFYLGPSDTLSAQVALVNYNKVPKNVLIAYDLEYVPGNEGIDVKTSLMSAGLCGGGGTIKTSKAGATNTTSGEFAFRNPGHLILAKGHLHDGGVAMHLYIDGAYKCSSRASYGAAIVGAKTQTISGMTDCNEEPIPMKSTSKFHMVSEYNLKAHPLRETTGHGEAGVMGMFRMIYAECKAGTSPQGARCVRA